MQDLGSVSNVLRSLKNGNTDGVDLLWKRYYTDLVEFARSRIRASRRVSDEEDVALSVFDVFARRIEQGRFPDLTRRDDLWRLLLHITEQKIVDHARFTNAAKRGGGVVRDSTNGVELNNVLAREQTPDFNLSVVEECERLLDLLTSEQREIAVCKLEGYTNREIAERLGRSISTVELRLRLIRKEWSAQS